MLAVSDDNDEETVSEFLVGAKYGKLLPINRY